MNRVLPAYGLTEYQNVYQNIYFSRKSNIIKFPKYLTCLLNYLKKISIQFPRSLVLTVNEKWFNIEKNQLTHLIHSISLIVLLLTLVYYV